MGIPRYVLKIDDINDELSLIWSSFPLRNSPVDIAKLHIEHFEVQ